MQQGAVGRARLLKSRASPAPALAAAAAATAGMGTSHSRTSRTTHPSRTSRCLKISLKTLSGKSVRATLLGSSSFRERRFLPRIFLSIMFDVLFRVRRSCLASLPRAAPARSVHSAFAGALASCPMLAGPPVQHVSAHMHECKHDTVHFLTKASQICVHIGLHPPTLCLHLPWCCCHSHSGLQESGIQTYAMV